MAGFVQRLLDKLRPTSGCPNCVDPGTRQLNWQHAVENPEDEEYGGYPDALRFVEPLKFGELFQCRRCGKYWVLDPHQIFMTLVEPEKQDLVIEWGRRDLAPTRKQLEKLLEIGSPGVSRYGSGQTFREFPCKCRMRSGELVDYCIVHVCRSLPILDDDYTVRLMDEVDEILDSEFALNFAVRDAAWNAREFRMMYSPTLVKNEQGRRYIINGSGYFMDYDEVVGAGISLADSGYSESLPMLDHRGSVWVPNSPDNCAGREPLPITIVLADWDESFPEPFPDDREFFMNVKPLRTSRLQT